MPLDTVILREESGDDYVASNTFESEGWQTSACTSFGPGPQNESLLQKTYLAVPAHGAVLATVGTLLLVVASSTMQLFRH